MDDDEYVDTFVQGDDGAMMAAIQARDEGVTKLLTPTAGNLAKQQALQLALQDPPYATKTEAVKYAAYEVVARVLGAIKESDIPAAVESLSLEQCDVLMKFLYRGLGQPGKKTDTYATLLKWHPVVMQRAGQASVVRAISEVRQGL